MERVIVSRHRATIEWIVRQLETEGLEARVGVLLDAVWLCPRADVDRSFGDPGSVVETIPIIAGNATADVVRGKDVYGNLPIDLAACAAVVRPVLFRGQLPRGADYTIEQMETAGVHLGFYVVKPATQERVAFDSALVDAVRGLRAIFDDAELITAGLNGDATALCRVLDVVRPIL